MYKYYVNAINYNNFTIRLVAPNVYQKNCSSIPIFSMTTYLLEEYNFFQSGISYYSSAGDHKIVAFLRCENQVNSSSYIDTTPCVNSSAFSPSAKKYYSYVFVGKDLTFSDLKDSCRVELVTLISTRKQKMSSYAEVHAELYHGFELSWEANYYRSLYGNYNDDCGK